VRHQVEEIIGQGQQAPSGHIPFTPRAKKVLELSSREAKKLGHKPIGTGHLLLGLIRERKGVAAQTLVQLGADLPTVRQQVIHQLSTYGDQEGTSAAEQELVDEELEFPDDELVEHAAFVFGDQVEEIRTLLRDIVERLERIERHLADDDDTP
jgi:ATP-dependent Clp protease ATP-binding subunit ClpA